MTLYGKSQSKMKHDWNFEEYAEQKVFKDVRGKHPWTKDYNPHTERPYWVLRKIYSNSFDSTGSRMKSKQANFFILYC